MTKIFILCGGKGTRMRHPESMPKALVDIGGGSVLSHQLRHYAKHGFKHYVFCIGYKGEEIGRYVQSEGFEVMCGGAEIGTSIAVNRFVDPNWL